MFGGAIAVASAHKEVLVSFSINVAAPMATVVKVVVIVPLPPSLSCELLPSLSSSSHLYANPGS